MLFPAMQTTPTWLHRAVPPELHDSHYCVSGAAIELCGSRESLLARTVAHLVSCSAAASCLLALRPSKR